MKYKESEKTLIKEMLNAMLSSGAEKSTNTLSKAERPIIGETKTRKERITITIKRETI